MPAGVVLGAYVCMVLLENTHRYQQILVPVTFTVIAVIVHELGVKLRSTAVLVFLAFFAIFDIYLS